MVPSVTSRVFSRLRVPQQQSCWMRQKAGFMMEGNDGNTQEEGWKRRTGSEAAHGPLLAAVSACWCTRAAPREAWAPFGRPSCQLVARGSACRCVLLLFDFGPWPVGTS
ncbi:unnamed protein product [Prorocentrum cordatum]|uniref:Uncharacterized protein n=1 Tax=Prorocentrum cordatum TaxID=2364126 RepID=A0ABN9RVD3_9DINO|nr:unnamed protein product [Polarella glacialis]